MEVNLPDGYRDQDPQPWYTNVDDPLPFCLQTKFQFEHSDTMLACVAPFPWDTNSLKSLWHGNIDTPQLRPGWSQLMEEWTEAIAAFGDRKLIVITKDKRTFCIDIQERDSSDEQAYSCCAWGLSSKNPLEPLVIFNDSRLLHILNVRQRKVVGTLIGHGGPITSIVVHPTYPYIFCTTSRDFTTRIYDLTLTPRQTPNNPLWPPGNKPSRGGAPAGLHSSEPEGRVDGVGRCVAILAGGRSGGHQAAVLNAAFHPTLPLLVTCGVSCFGRSLLGLLVLFIR